MEEKLETNCVSEHEDIKSKKMNGMEFHPVQFLKALLSNEDEITELKMFKTLAQKLPEYDAVLKFLCDSGSTDGAEFINLFKSKRPMSELAVIFEALEAIFLRIADDLTDYHSWGLSLIGQLVQPNVMRNIYHGLAMTNTSREIKATVNFLTSMVTVSPTAAKQVASHFNFNENIILPLLSRINIKDIGDVRASTVHFLLSFLMSGDDSLIQQLLDQKRILNGIFPDLIYDKAATIYIVLNTLKSQVVENKSISKTSKIRLFNANTLKLVFNLFGWTGAKVYAKEKRKAKLTAAEKEAATYTNFIHSACEHDASMIHQLTHEFLIAVCCSYKNGIIFLDRSFGTSKRNYNHVITNLLSTIGKPYASTIVEKTVVEILRACPDQMVYYIPTLKEALLPRPSSAWIIAIAFLIKVLNAYDLRRILKLMNEQIPPKMLSNIIMNIITTSLFTQEVLQNAVRHADFCVRNYILQYVDAVLKQASRILLEQDKEILAILRNKNDFKTLKEKFVTNLRKVLPSIEDLVFCWNLVTDSFTGSMTQKDDSFTNKYLIGEELHNHLKLLIGVINIYVKVFHDHLPSFDSGLLLGVGNINNRLEKMQLYDVYIRALQLLTDTKPDKFLLIKKINDKPIITLLCEMMSTPQGSTLQERTFQLIKQLLISTGLFQSVENEIDLWLRAFQNANDSNSISEFFQSLLTDIIVNSQMYLDLTSDAILKAVSVFTNDNTDIYSRIFDEILSEQGHVEDSNDNWFSDENVALPKISVMVVASLKALKNKSENSNVHAEFVTSVLYDILHCQYHPEGLCYIIQSYSHGLPIHFKEYMQNFYSLKQSGTKGKISHASNDETSLSHLIAEVKSCIGDIEDLLKISKRSSSPEKLCTEVQKLLFYLKFLLIHENKAKSVDVISLCCELLLNLLMDSNEFCHAKKGGQKCSVTCDIAQVHEVAHLILNHPVIHDGFLHPDLLDNQSPDDAFWQLTKLSLVLLNRILSSGKPNTSFHLLKDKMIKFMLKRLSLLRKLILKEVKSVCSLVKIVEPFMCYLEPSVLEAFVDILCNCPEEVLFAQEAVMLKLTDCGELLISVLKFIAVASHVTNRPPLKANQILQCANLYLNIMHRESNCKQDESTDFTLKTTFGTVLLQLLENNGLYAFAMNRDFLEFCLEDVYCPTSLMLADVLLQKNWNNLAFFCEWALNSTMFQVNFVMYTELCIHFLDGVKNRVYSPFSENYRHSLKKFLKLQWPLILQALLNYENLDEHLNLEIENACSLLKSFCELNVIDSQLMVNFAESCLKSCRSDIPIPCTVLLSSQKLFTVLSDSKHLIDNKPASALYVMLCLKVILATDKSYEESVVDIIERNVLIDVIIGVLENDSPIPCLGKALHQEKLWHNFIKITLKVGLKDENGANMLHLIKAVINGLLQNKELVSFHASLIFELILGHSNFLPGILDTSLKNIEWREGLLDLLLLLVKIIPSVARKVHIPIYLSSYTASMHKVDQKLLMLIYFYEKHGIDVHSYRPFMWGNPAIEHYAVLKSLTQSLWKQPSMEAVLHLFNSDKLLKTALNFPLALKLKMENQLTNEKFIELCATPTEDIYDPRFLLGLFSSLLAPESLVHCHEFISCNGLAFLFATLGSEDDEMRAIGYHCLANFYQHLEGARFIQKAQWLYLLDCVRNAIETPNVKLPNIITVFFIKTCHLLINPVNELAKPVTRFLFLKPALDVWNIPDFYFLFSNPDVLMHRVYRNWILTVISEGLRSAFDYRICQKRYIFKIILSYFVSPTADHDSKELILSILKAAVKIRSVVIDLFSHHGILAVVHAMIKNSSPGHISELIDILHISWKTLSIAQDTVLSESKGNSLPSITSTFTNTSATPCIQSRSCNPLLTAEFLMALLSAVDHLTIDTSVDMFANYLATLTSVLNYISNDLQLIHVGVQGITTPMIKQLLHVNNSIVCKRELGEELTENSYGVVLVDQNVDGEHNPNEDGTTASHMNLEQFLLIKQSQQNLCEVFLHWRVDAACVSDMLNTEDASKCTDVCDTFVSVCCLLLKSALHSESDFPWLHRMYRWLNNTLLEDKSGILTTSIINFATDGDIFSHLFKMLELFLSIQNEEFGDLEGTDNESTIPKLDVVVQLSQLFITLIQNLLTVDSNAALQSTYPSDVFLTHLFEDKVRDVLQLPLTQTLIKALNEANKSVQYKAAISISTMACELWLQAEEMENFMYVVQHLLNSHIDVLIENHELPILESNKLKRKSSPKQERVKRKRSL